MNDPHEDVVNTERPTESLAEKAQRLGADTQPPVDEEPDPAQPLLRLADELSRQYDFRDLTELQQEDPERAQEHWGAAQALLSWIAQCPREERRAAFLRGFDRGRERQMARTEEDLRRLEAEAAELRTERAPEDLRGRIRDLEAVLDGWNRRMTGRTRLGEDVDWKEQAADYLLQLSAAQRELAILKGVQPDDAARRAAT
ncbi:hypothetical protein AB0454_22530 [Streptomyces sp. NPDC093509]|uniref:hypothetical protein n=1 Tax=Streptomyces sp. NPDC093509 TaxID=3154982 RepID=UPI00344C7614